MPRGRRNKVVEKDYDTEIARIENDIAKLNDNIKSKKSELRQLKKDKIKYDEQKAAEKAESEKQAVVDMIERSGKSMEEIKEFLSGESNEKSDTK